MLDRTDHVAKALENLDWADEIMGEVEVSDALLATVLIAQAEATLALVEQQQIANRLEMRAQIDTAERNREPYALPLLRPDVAAALVAEVKWVRGKS